MVRTARETQAELAGRRLVLLLARVALAARGAHEAMRRSARFAPTRLEASQ